MRPLIALSVRSVAAAMSIVLGIGLAGGLVRLLPWLVAREVPWRLSAPFAEILAASALEVALVVGLPVGVGVASSLFVERGEARALLALGATPGRLVVGLAGPGLLVVLVGMGVASVGGRGRPGVLLSRLVGDGRRACSGAVAPRRVDVPLVPVAWLCLASGPRLAGRVPGLSGSAWFSASALTPSDDLASLEAEDAHFGARMGDRVVLVRARSARVVGLPGWGARVGKLAGPLRGLVVSGSSLITALAAAWLVVRRTAARPIAAAATSAVAALAMLQVLRVLDGRSAALFWYPLLPVVGVIVAGVGSCVVSRVLSGRVAGNRGG